MPLSQDEILDLLVCPVTGSGLQRTEFGLSNADQSIQYGMIKGIPDLRVPPPRLSLDLPWYEPWQDLRDLNVSAPEPLEAADLPYHLDKYLASVAGLSGNGRNILEVGCGDRQCEQWFTRAGFRYVGTDIDVRGQGPHLLSDAHNLPFRADSFDLYTSMAVYEHLMSPLLAAIEAFRVLKSGGTFFGSSAFVFGFHDRASFHHMSHAGLLWVLRSSGFVVERMWADWRYTQSIPQMAFRGLAGAPWRLLAQAVLEIAERSFVLTSNAARLIAGKRRIDRDARELANAGSVSFVARKP